MAQVCLSIARIVWGIIVALALIGCEGGARQTALSAFSFRLSPGTV